MLKIAIQKSGRLYEESIQLLKSIGLRVDNSKDQLKASVKNFPAEVLFLRNSDIPQYLEQGVADMAIIGDNVVIEKEVDIQKLLPLGFSTCRLSIATAKDFNYESIQDLDGRRIASSYPNTLRQYLKKQGIKADIHLISGSVEIAPNIGLADAICDLVSSGSTLFKNNLIEREIILKSEASLYCNSTSLLEKAELIQEIQFRMEGVRQADKYDYILFNVPNSKISEVSKVLPGLKSPTILPLVEEGWSSMHSVIQKDKFWTLISQLKSLGAEGILVSPVSKIVL